MNNIAQTTDDATGGAYPIRTVSDLTRILEIQDPARTAHHAELLRLAGIPD